MISRRVMFAVFSVAMTVALAVGGGCQRQEDSGDVPGGGEKPKPVDPRAEAERILREDGPKASDISLCRDRAKALAALGEAAIEPTAKAIESKDYGTVMLAARALSQFGEKGRVALIAALSSPNAQTRFWAARYLKDTGDVRALGGLLKMVDSQSMTSKDAGKGLIKIGKPAAPGLLALLKSPKRDVRCGAIQLLGEIGDARAIEPLAALLGNKEYLIRVEAGKALAKHGELAIDALGKALKSTDRNTVQTASRALRGIDEPHAAAAAAALAAALSPDKSNYALVSALLKLGPKAVEPLLPILKDANRKRAKVAGDVLSQIPDPRVVAPLLVAYDTIRSHSTDILDNLAKTPKIAEKPAITILQKTDASPDARAAAAYLLGRIKSGPAVDPLVTVALIESSTIKDRALQRAAIRALGAIGQPRAIAPLKEILDQTNSRYTRDVAIEVLGALDAQDMTDRFISELDSVTSWMTAKALVRALGSLGAVRSVPAIGNCITRMQGHSDFVQTAIEVLEKIGAPAAVEVVESMATHKTLRVRCAAARALGTLGKPSSVKVLAAMGTEKDLLVQRSVLSACVKIGTPEAIAVVRTIAVEGGSHYVRSGALDMLVKHDPKNAAFLIARYPVEKNWSVRSIILRVLTEQRIAEAMPLFLAVAANTEAGGARTKAFWGLAAMGNTATVAVLEKHKAATETEMNRNRNHNTIYTFAAARDALSSLKTRLKRQTKPTSQPK